ncbi:MAG: hypothetical protein AAF823_09195 [Planctomycetota bacterium]
MRKRIVSAGLCVVWVVALAIGGAVGVGSAAAQSAESEGVALRPAWAVGQRALYEFWTQRERQIDMQFDGRSRTVSTTLSSEGQTEWVVTEVGDDGSAKGTMTLQWIVITVTQPDGSTMKVDSRRAGGDIPAYKQLLDAVAGVPLMIEVAADGSVASVEGMNQMTAKYGGDEFPLEERDFVETATDLAALTGVPAMVVPGQRWSTTHDWSHELGTMRHDLNWTLSEVEDVEGIGLAVVDVTGELTLELGDDAIPADAPQTQVRLVSGSIEGQVLFDTLRREAVGRNTVQNDVIRSTTRLPQNRGTLVRTTTQRVQSQSLRIEEGE